jgi:hypothetical protein
MFLVQIKYTMFTCYWFLMVAYGSLHTNVVLWQTDNPLQQTNFTAQLLMALKILPRNLQECSTDLQYLHSHCLFRRDSSIFMSFQHKHHNFSINDKKFSCLDPKSLLGLKNALNGNSSSCFLQHCTLFHGTEFLTPWQSCWFFQHD